MLLALTPMRIYRLRPAGVRAYALEGVLDWNDVVSGDGPFSDSNGISTSIVSTQRGSYQKVYPIRSSFNFRLILVANERI